MQVNFYQLYLDKDEFQPYYGIKMKGQKTTLAVKVHYGVAEQVKRFCRERGLKYGFFVEKAILEQLAREELKEDLVDLKDLRELERQAVPLGDYLKKRRV